MILIFNGWGESIEGFEDNFLKTRNKRYISLVYRVYSLGDIQAKSDLNV
jgi:hypothetical protein